MVKEIITYTDFNGNKCTDELYFNLNERELIKLQKKLPEGGFEGIDFSDIDQIFDLFETIIKAAYGVKSEDGKRFIKNELITEEFTQTAAYDEFFNSIISNDQKAADFFNAVIPNSVDEKISEEDREKIEEKIKEDIAAGNKVDINTYAKELAAQAEPATQTVPTTENK